MSLLKKMLRVLSLNLVLGLVVLLLVVLLMNQWFCDDSWVPPQRLGSRFRLKCLRIWQKIFCFVGVPCFKVVWVLAVRTDRVFEVGA